MKVVRAFLAFLLTAAILCCGVWVLAASACSRVLARESVTELLGSSDLMEAAMPIVEGSLTEDTLGGMAELVKKLLDTEAMHICINRYAIQYACTILYGDPTPYIDPLVLESALSDAFDELTASESLDTLELLGIEGVRLFLPSVSEEIAGQAQAAIPSRASLLAQFGLSEQLLGDLTYLTGSEVRTILGIALALLSLIVILLYLKTGVGFLWLGSAAAICGAIFAAGGLVFWLQATRILAEYGLDAVSHVVLRALLIRGGCALGAALLLLCLGNGIRSAARRKVRQKPSYVPPEHGMRHSR